MKAGQSIQSSDLKYIRARSTVIDLAGFPDFLILGPQRTGTTWLYHNLRRHPRIFLPDVKETYYFSTLGKPDHAHYRFEDLEDYLELFRDTFRRRIKRHYDALRQTRRFFRPDIYGEATATYAMLPENIIEEILKLNPRLRAILMIRDPVERAWSHAKKDLLRAGVRMDSVEDCWKFLESAGQLKCADYAGMAEKWRRFLPQGALFCGDYRRLSSDPGGLLADLCRFLGVDADLLPVTGLLQERINPTEDLPMPEGLRERLEERFAADRKEALQLLRSER
ncbi:MAG: hypothetical protein Fur0032_02870 [Terrimicrobiaceae bacterium]